MVHKFVLGDLVENFGVRGVVWKYHTTANGEQETGMLILRDAFGMRWVADPDKCSLVKSGYKYIEGFVIV